MERMIAAENLRKSYSQKRRETVSAVAGVTLSLKKGASLGLVGESGCGKSTLGRMLSGLETPTSGSVFYREKNISALSLSRMRPLRRNIQMIFQNSGGVFDPSYTIGHSIGELIRNCENVMPGEREKRVGEILMSVGLDASYALRRSSELSGGQRQRCNIARALVLRPEFVVCDEPVSNLDCSLRKQVLTLLNDLREKLSLTYLFITHDLNCLPYSCDGIAVMYAGRIVESFDLTRLGMSAARHPYTRLLISSSPAKTPAERQEAAVQKTPPDDQIITDGKSCCRFYPRCAACGEKCEREDPVLKEVGDEHLVACHYV